VNIFLQLYLQISKRKFRNTFNPLGIAKKAWYLVSVPSDTMRFFRTYPLISALSKVGNVVLLMPQHLEHIRAFMKPKQFEIILYEKTPTLFSEDFKRVSVQLGDRHFHFLIELDLPANVSLPYLSNFDKRIAIYDKANFPYYNILMRNGINSLADFLGVDPNHETDLFHFYSRELKAAEKKISKPRPLLFVNGPEPVEWKGGKVVLGEDVMPDDPNIWTVLYTVDAYYGTHDAHYEFARINNKQILDSKQQ
jgi:hypothetical protein